MLTHEPGVLSRLTAEQGTTGLDAALRDAADQRGDLLRDDLADGDVVLHEQRLGTGDHQIVDDHGGRIEVTSKVGEGTHFVVHLPLTIRPKGARK